MANWWNRRINQYMGQGWGDTDWEKYYGQNPYKAGQDYPLGSLYSARQKQLEFGNPSYKPPALGQSWGWGDPKLGVYDKFAKGVTWPAKQWQQEQQDRGMSTMLKGEYDWLLGNQKGNISDDMLRQIMPPQIGMDQAMAARTRPSGSRPSLPAGFNADGTRSSQYKLHTEGPVGGGSGTQGEIEARTWAEYQRKVDDWESGKKSYENALAPLQELNALGYFPTQGYAYNPAMGSIGGIGPTDYGTQTGPGYLGQASVGGGAQASAGGGSPTTGSDCLGGGCGAVAPNPGGVDSSNMMVGKGSVPGQATSHDGVQVNSIERDGPPSGETRTWESYQREMRAAKSDNPFGESYNTGPDVDVPMTPGAMQNMSYLDSMPGQLINQYSTLANQGIYGTAGLQTIFNAGINPVIRDLLGREDQLTGLVDTSTDKMLEDINQRTPQILNSIRQSEALQRSRMASGMANSLPSSISSQPGQMAKAVAEQVTGPSLARQAGMSADLQREMGGKSDSLNQARLDSMLGIKSSLGSSRDALKMQRGEFVAENMRSKLQGLAGLGTTTNLIGNLIGSRYWDTSMRNKYGWTPFESGWVNQELQRMQHQYNMTEQEARYALEQQLAESQKQTTILAPSGFGVTI